MGRFGAIRVRVTLAATAGVAAVLVVACLVLLSLQRRELNENLDNTLRLRVDDIAADIAAGNIGLGANPARDGEVGLIQIVAADGTVLAATANVEGDPPVAAPPPDDHVEVLRSVAELPIDDDSFRILSRWVDSSAGRLVVHAAASADPAKESVADLRALLFRGLPFVVAALGGIVWVLVGRTLHPIEAIRAEVAGIGGTDLHRRVPVPGVQDEVGRLARTMNDMLDRIESSSLRQQQFVADASHELRSPLTRIRTELEVDLAHPGESDHSATHRSVLAEAEHLQRLVEDLLHLARSDAGLGPRRTETVDLDDLVLREGRRMRETGRVRVDLSGVSAGQVQGDPDQLLRVVRNLADNAGRHAADAVTFTLGETGSSVVLTVSDDGPGIDPKDAVRVFERFTRLDESRVRDEGGTGLGLAIVRDIVEAHGGCVRLDPDHAPGARFVIELPRT